MDLMTSPLPYEQVAPKGFLFVEKIAVYALGTSDYALRLFPFICSVLALVVFWHLAVRVLREPGAVVAVFLFALAPPLIAFGALVKQYSADVCAAVVLLWIGVELESRVAKGQRPWWIVIGSVVVWFSQPAVLVIAGVSLSLIWIGQSRPEGFRRRLRELAPMLALWGASSFASTIVALASVTPETRQFLSEFWAEGFPPDSLSHAVQTLWPRWQLWRLFGAGGQASLGYTAPDLYVGLVALGVVVLWRSNRTHALLLAGPIAVALAAAVARQYPFSDRLIVGLVPAFLIFLAASIEWIAARVRSRSTAAANVVLVALVAPAVYPVLRTPPVYRVEDIKPVLSFVRSHWRSSDEVYVFYGAVPAVGLYAQRYGFAERGYSAGGCHRRDGRQYLREVDAFRSHSKDLGGDDASFSSRARRSPSLSRHNRYQAAVVCGALARRRAQSVARGSISLRSQRSKSPETR